MDTGELFGEFSTNEILIVGHMSWLAECRRGHKSESDRIEVTKSDRVTCSMPRATTDGVSLSELELVI